MFKKTISYVDYDGNNRSEDFYFNLNKSELTDLELSVNGGITNHIKKISDTQDAPALAKLFKDLILMSYGEKTADGRGFKKSKELSDDFASTIAFDELYMELISDSDKASEFINKVVPADLAEKANNAETRKFIENK